MSPDLNPIEHMWGILKWKVEKHHVSNIQQLRDVIMEEWKRMPATTCAALVNSMPRRIKAVLDNNGAPTKYSNQIKSLLLSHHHSTSALVSEILESVLQTVQKNKTIYI